MIAPLRARPGGGSADKRAFRGAQDFIAQPWICRGACQNQGADSTRRATRLVRRHRLDSRRVHGRTIKTHS
jgi:hypothetical protein